MTARRLSEQEIEAILRQRRASAEAAAKGRAHRALPLAEVERRAQAARTAWPMRSCSTSCHTSVCDCEPREGASASSEFLADPPKPQPPAVPWRQLIAGLMVLLFTALCAHVIATAAKPVQQVAKR